MKLLIMLLLISLVSNFAHADEAADIEAAKKVYKDDGIDLWVDRASFLGSYYLVNEKFQKASESSVRLNYLWTEVKCPTSIELTLHGWDTGYGRVQIISHVKLGHFLSFEFNDSNAWGHGGWKVRVDHRKGRYITSESYQENMRRRHHVKIQKSKLGILYFEVVKSSKYPKGDYELSCEFANSL